MLMVQTSDASLNDQTEQCKTPRYGQRGIVYTRELFQQWPEMTSENTEKHRATTKIMDLNQG
jgi:hypothetical protein